MSPIGPDDLHRIFKNLDRKHEGQVSILELHQMLDAVGVPATLEELENLVGLDNLDFLFFYEAAIKARLGENNNEAGDQRESDLARAFKVFDLNNDGYISCEELQSELLKLGLWDMGSGGDCRDMIRVYEYDENSDGVLDFGEFKNMLMFDSNTFDHSKSL